MNPEPLIVDDLGLRTLRNEEPEDLYDLIPARYEPGASVITSNRDVTDWPSLFGDPLMASAAMDRVLHHATVVVLDGRSYRNPPKARPGRERSVWPPPDLVLADRLDASHHAICAWPSRARACAGFWDRAISLAAPTAVPQGAA